MSRGLLWLPLLVTFIWLTWSGWNEYQKLETYKIWAEQFDNAKYDIYAVLGKKDGELTWGKPTRKGIVDLNTLSLNDVKAINLVVEKDVVDVDTLPSKGKPILVFSLIDKNNSIQIPFTDISLAAKWCKYLQQEWKQVKDV